MVDETIFGSIAFGLEGTEKSLLGTENLNSGSWVLGEVGQATGMADEACCNRVTDESSKVGSDQVHLFMEVGLKGRSVVEKLDDAISKVGDVDEIDRRDVGAHRSVGGIQDALCSLLVAKDVCNLAHQGVFIFVGLRTLHGNGNKLALVANSLDDLGVLSIVGDHLDKLGEVPAVPFTDTHGEKVDILVELVKQSDSLNDHVVGSVHVELDFGTRVGMTKTEASLNEVVDLEAGKKLLGMQSKTTNKRKGAVGGVAFDIQSRLDGTGKTSFANAEQHLGALAGQVLLEQCLQVRVQNTFRDIVGVLKGLCKRSRCEWEGSSSSRMVKEKEDLRAASWKG